MYTHTHTHLYTSFLLHSEAFTHTHRSFTNSSLYSSSLTSFYAQKITAFFRANLLHTTSFTHRSFDTHAHRSIYTRTILHTKDFTHRRFCTQRPFHRAAFTRVAFMQNCVFAHRCFTHRKRFLHRNTFTQARLHRRAFPALQINDFTQRCRSFSTEKLLRREDFAQNSFNTQQLLHVEAFFAQKLLPREALTQSMVYFTQSSFRKQI